MPLLLNDSISTHPILQIASQQIKVTDAERKAAASGLLPKLNAQYGAQEVEGQSGFYQFQIGVSIPLSFLPQQGRLQSAKIQQQIAEQEYRQTQFELQAGYQSLLQQYRKWLASWRFYEDEALPLAREQRQGAVLAYKEGAIDYVSFIQNLKEAVQVEVKAQEALNQYLESKFQLEYYLNTSNK
jgi:cobalt-zinc-cadmium resistance protein CzcA